MTYLRTNTARPNALNWPLGFGDIENQLDTLFAGLPSLFEVQQKPSAPQASAASDAKLRWYEKPEAYLVRVDLPGVKKEDISVELAEGAVTVSATRKFESNDASKNPTELKYAKTFRVPDGVQDGAIAANFENGVLALSLPKTEKAQPRQISIS